MEDRQKTIITDSVVTQSKINARLTDVKSSGDVICMAGGDAEFILNLLKSENNSQQPKQRTIPDEVEAKNISLTGDVIVIGKQKTIVDKIKCTGTLFNCSGVDSIMEAEQLKELISQVEAKIQSGYFHKNLHLQADIYNW